METLLRVGPGRRRAPPGRRAEDVGAPGLPGEDKRLPRRPRRAAHGGRRQAPACALKLIQVFQQIKQFLDNIVEKTGQVKGGPKIPSQGNLPLFRPVPVACGQRPSCPPNDAQVGINEMPASTGFAAADVDNFFPPSPAPPTRRGPCGQGVDNRPKTLLISPSGRAWTAAHTIPTHGTPRPAEPTGACPAGGNRTRARCGQKFNRPEYMTNAGKQRQRGARAPAPGALRARHPAGPRRKSPPRARGGQSCPRPCTTPDKAGRSRGTSYRKKWISKQNARRGAGRRGAETARAQAAGAAQAVRKSATLLT